MADNPLTRFVRYVFDRESARKTETEMAASLAQAGKKGGENFLRELRAAFTKRKAELKVQLAQGLISPEEYRKQGALAAKEFNAGILRGMEEARKAGTLTEKEYLKLSRTLKQVGHEGATAFDRLKAGIARAGAALVFYFGGRQIARFLADIVRVAREADAIWNRLAGALDTVGVSFGTVGREIEKAARAMQRATVVGDEEFAAVLTELVTTSGDYARSLQNVQLVADLAAAKQIDLSTAAKLVGRVMVGETGTLKRYGIVVQEGADALEVMRQKFQGMAENEARTFHGRVVQLRNAWSDFKEELGKALIDASRGASILDRATRAVYYLTENIHDLLGLVKDLTKAILVAGAVLAFTRLRAAIIAGQVAVVGFTTALRAAWVAIGPVGWFTTAVIGLTAAFQAMGKAAREAAAEARQALDDFRDEVGGLPESQLAAEVAALEDRKVALARRIATLTDTLQRMPAGRDTIERRIQLTKQLTAAQLDLADVTARLGVIGDERRARAAGRPTATGPTDPAEPSDRQKALAAELERINRELHVRLVMREQDLTRDLAAEFVRRQELLTGRTVEIVRSLEEGWARLDEGDRQAAILERAGFGKTLIPKVRQPVTEVVTAMEPLADVAPMHAAAAERTESAWVKALRAIEDETLKQGGLFAELGEAWAEGGLRGLARFAAGKVRENIAQAIEHAAKALGSLAFGNVAGASLNAKAAAGHTAAAAAWRLVGGAAGGTGRGASGGAPASAAVSANPSAGPNAQGPGAEVHIYLQGSLNATNVEFQRAVFGAQQQARERYGANASIRVHREGA